MGGMDPPTCEMKLMEKALTVTYYGQEIYHVRSDAQPGLKKLTMTLGPVGIGLYQNTVKLDIFNWMEIWNVGYINSIFWFRVMRDGEKSKHKFHFNNNKTCEHVWRAFRDFFQFYVQERKVDQKLMWGRQPPKVQRLTLLSEHQYHNHTTPSIMRHANVVPKISRDNFSSLLADPGNFGNPMMHSDPGYGGVSHHGNNNINYNGNKMGANGHKQQDLAAPKMVFTSDKTLTGSGRGNNYIQQQNGNEIHHNRRNGELQNMFHQHQPNDDNLFTTPTTTNSQNDEDDEGILTAAI